MTTMKGTEHMILSNGGSIGGQDGSKLGLLHSTFFICATCEDSLRCKNSHEPNCLLGYLLLAKNILIRRFKEKVSQ